MTTDLTDRELTILLMLADGYTITQIGLELDRANCTVKQIIITIKRKLKAKNITNAVALAYQKGILLTYASSVKNR